MQQCAGRYVTNDEGEIRDCVESCSDENLIEKCMLRWKTMLPHCQTMSNLIACSSPSLQGVRAYNSFSPSSCRECVVCSTIHRVRR